MEFEQKPPNSPNFRLVVILAGVALLVLLVVAIVLGFIPGTHFNPMHQTKNPNASIVLQSPIVG